MNKKYKDIKFAKLDTDRIKRRKAQETIYCASKTNEWLYKIFNEFKKEGQNVLGTKATPEQAEYLKEKIPEIKYNKLAKTLVLIQKEIIKNGEAVIVTGGTGDIPIAEEAAETAEFFGANVKKYYDIGIAGLHRLLDSIEEIKKADVIIVLAGMEGALAGVITGLVDVPVIAVPTSVGYGASLNGLSALLTMINSCAEGMTVVYIDNGFNAGYSAAQIVRLINKGN